MFYGNRQKNPFFLPALITALLPAVILFCVLPINRLFNAPLENLLYFLMITATFAAIILSVAGLVNAGKLQEPFIGCVFCLVLALLEIFIFSNYFSRPIRDLEVTIVPHSLSPEESASAESINEEIRRAMKGKTAT